MLSQRLFLPPTPHRLQSLCLFRNAIILTGDGQRHDNTDLYIESGRVGWIGEGETAPETLVVDASDRWITPGLIDVHSHLGVYPSPGVAAHSDGNEATAPVTAEVWAEPQRLASGIPASRARWQAVSPQCKFCRASANLFGGRGVTLKNVPSTSYQGMKFPDAPYGLKNGMRGEPKKGLRGSKSVALYPNGQCRGLSKRLDSCPTLSS